MLKRTHKISELGRPARQNAGWHEACLLSASCVKDDQNITLVEDML